MPNARSSQVRRRRTATRPHRAPATTADAAAGRRTDGSGLRLGAHMSIAGGLETAVDRARAAGCDCLQIFVKNQRQWAAAPLARAQVDVFRAAQERSGITPVIAHATYLINLASPDVKIRRKSIDATADELERCEALGVLGLVLHPGAATVAGGHSERTRRRTAVQNGEDSARTDQAPSMSPRIAAGVSRIAGALDEIHTRCRGFRSQILLETTAGQGNAIGARFDELAGILDRVRTPDRLGICLDTCHLFAAGYDLRTPAGYAATMAELERTVGAGRVRCIHMNDSKRELGSRVDRHEHIGKGRIGKEGFHNVVCDPRWTGIPMILETPKGTDGRGTDLDRVNLKRLRRLAGVA